MNNIYFRIHFSTYYLEVFSSKLKLCFYWLIVWLTTVNIIFKSETIEGYYVSMLTKEKQVS